MTFRVLLAAFLPLLCSAELYTNRTVGAPQCACMQFMTALMNNGCDQLSEFASEKCGIASFACEAAGSLLCEAISSSSNIQNMDSRLCGMWGLCSSVAITYSPTYTGYKGRSCSGSTAAFDGHGTLDLTQCWSGGDIAGSVRGICSDDGKTVSMTQYRTNGKWMPGHPQPPPPH
jgi:hypothetical protein